jgi:pyridinium-3,5-biscarboxylic acid mononucleotide synthase
MDVARLRQLLERVQDGSVPIDDALSALKSLPYEDLGFAKVDHHRALRNGFPEVIYCPSKTTEHILGILDRLTARSPKILATRASTEVAARVKDQFPRAVYHELARILVVPGVEEEETVAPRTPTHGTVLVVSAGTADLPVAEEAAITAAEMGSPVERLYDVGVAGIHRLLNNQDRLFAANVLVVVAGMEGALPSVIGGLVARPVVAVPTSVGYGANFNGLSALLTMLNSCATGIGVVNIDNGFGGGYLAHLINQAVPVKS